MTTPTSERLMSRDMADALVYRLKALMASTEKFNEADWQRNRGRFANYLGQSGGGGGGGGGGAAAEAKPGQRLNQAMQRPRVPFAGNAAQDAFGGDISALGGGGASGAGVLTRGDASAPTTQWQALQALERGQPVTMAPSEFADFVDIARVRENGVNMQNMQVTGAANRNMFRTHATEYPREKMPQLPETVEGMDDYKNFIASKGIPFRVDTVDPRELMATQNYIDSVKTAGIATAVRKEGKLREGADTLVVSANKEVVDGHHRWSAIAAHAISNPGTTVNIVQLDTDIETALRVSQEYADSRGIASEGANAGFREGGAGARGKALRGKAKLSGQPVKDLFDVPLIPAPDPNKPYMWLNGKWYLIMLDSVANDALYGFEPDPGRVAETPPDLAAKGKALSETEADREAWITATFKAIDAEAIALKFNEADWQRNRGRFANFIGRFRPGGGGAGGAGTLDPRNPTRPGDPIQDRMRQLRRELDAGSVGPWKESPDEAVQRWRRTLDAEAAAKEEAKRNLPPAIQRVSQTETGVYPDMPNTASADLRAWADRIEADSGAVAVGPDARNVARRLSQKAQTLEPKTTNEIAQMTIDLDQGAAMAGLQYRLKGENSLARKIQSEAEWQGLKPERVTVADSVRYTMTFERNRYGAQTQQAINKMRDNGYVMDKPPNNFWTSGDGTYRGINTFWRAPGSKPGDPAFEVQFHTPQTYRQKTANHKMYQVARSPDGAVPPAIRGEAERLMRDSWAEMPMPGGDLRSIKAALPPLPAEMYFRNPTYGNALYRIIRENGGLDGQRWTPRGWVFCPEVIAARMGGGQWSDYIVISEADANRKIEGWLADPETMPEALKG